MRGGPCIPAAAPPWLLLLLAAACGLAGCDRSEPDMLRQPRWNRYAGSTLFSDGSATRPPPPGSVAQDAGVAAAASGGRRGAATLDAQEAEQARQALPARPPRAMLVRGQQRYAVYCLPCHSPVGDGDGPVVERGFPAPPSFHTDALRSASDRHLYDVVSNGWGLMYRLGDRIEPADRWAIVAFVRALQLSRHAPLAELPAGLRAAVAAPPADQWHAVPQEQTP